ncbi:MAG: prepilin-type N-terminal cleavage/methylation domain-containing protein [Leptolyngbyaceae cyanobacterium RM1_405_57]|nr:prepilin-type N-terminal cleavage/methylation domain-containing protein [Leptolyngbyaceae cyanobacterium RM1_405_57]
MKSLDRAFLSRWQGSNLSKSGSSEQGVTLLECLVAISVIALLGAMITPPLLLLLLHEFKIGGQSRHFNWLKRKSIAFGRW